MISSRLKELLESNEIPFQSIPHAVSYDAQRTAEAAHVRGQEFAKAVIVRADGRLCMAVLPATDHVDLNLLRSGLGAQEVVLADQNEIQEAFPDCDVGAMPPFGELYGIEVFVSPRLREDERITFKSGSHDEAVAMRYSDYERLVQPTMMRF